jgi:fructose-1,6-bisphosphatase/inositol monophosphatase family enzyme
VAALLKARSADGIIRIVAKDMDGPIVGVVRAPTMDSCYVAMGAFDGYFEAGLKEWDLAARGLVAREAGARVSTSSCGITIFAGSSLCWSRWLRPSVDERGFSAYGGAVAR